MNDLFYKGSFGIERETLRIDSNGRLAQTPHPFGEDERLTRDFCENQTEIVTPVCQSIDEAMEKLSELDTKARKILSENDESFWLYSNPPRIENEDEIPIANFIGEHSGKRLYRDQLERRYGKRLMLFSGIHFNFSFSDDYLRSVCDDDDFEMFKSRFYLKLYRQASVHSWLPLLLTAASPVYDISLDRDGQSGAELSEYSSLRSSKRGYWNGFVPVLNTENIGSFVGSIEYYVNKGVLFSASELYLPVRLKPRGINKLENFVNGISHIELRMFDLNPFEPLGIDRHDLEFAHLLLMYLSRQPDIVYNEEQQIRAVENHKKAAKYDLSEVYIDNVPIIERASQIIDDMDRMLDTESSKQILRYEKDKLNDLLCRRIKAEDIYKRR